MKNLLSSLFMVLLLTMGSVNLYAQEDIDTTEPTTQTTQPATQPDQPTPLEPPAGTAEAQGFHQILKEKFIEGDWRFMTPILICLLIGLAIAIERIIYLNMATTNKDKLLNNIEDALNAGGTDAAKEVCRNTKGPVASIFYQGLDRAHEGIDIVEKSVISYGSIQMGLLERGLIWISLFISIAPMLGFFGTVVGMIVAFDAIEAAGDISPSLVAGGIKVALLTTVMGLLVAMILQIFYNYLVSKIDGLVNTMEDASISLIDLLVKHEMRKRGV